MKYVEIDEQGTVSWDRYFEYLRGVQAQFPPEVYSYAIKREHYALDSVSSLHDAWLTCARFAYRERELTLEFLGPWHDRTHVMKYSGVKSYMFDILVKHRLGDGDVLAHEFRIEDGHLAHEIEFSNRKSILVIADTVQIRSELHGSPTAEKN